MIFRKQILLIIFFTLIGPIGLLYGIALNIILESSSQLEQRDVRQNVERLLQAVSNETATLNSKSGDWANWDDAYNFMQDKNPNFVKSNIHAQAFLSLKLNFILFVDPANRLIAGQGFDRIQSKSIDIPESLRSQLKPNALLRPVAPNSNIRALGILMLPESPLLLVSREILTSEAKGPSRGTLIFARYLDASEVSHLAATTNLSVTVKQFDDPQLPLDFQVARISLSQDRTKFVSPLSNDEIGGYAIVNDIYGKPALILRVDIPRDIYKQGLANLLYLLISLLIVGLVFGSVFGGVALSLLRRLEHYLSALKQSQQNLFQAKELAEITLYSIGDAVIATNAKGEVEQLNPIAEQLTGWTNDKAKGLPLSEVFSIVDGHTGEPLASPVEAALREARVVELASNAVLIGSDGQEFAIDDSAAPILTKEGEVIGAVLVFRDVTSERAMENLLSWEASHDALTNLVNRREFERCLRQALAIAKTQDKQHVLAYLDLDRFKVVNDTCGHLAGDELLCQVAALMQTTMRKADTLARIGGDEFGIIFYDCPTEKAQHLAEEIRQIIQEFGFVWDNKTFNIGVSIGLVEISANSLDVASIMGTADAACYAAKEAGWNQIRFYKPDDRELVRQRQQMQWLPKINRALAENGFRLYYQSIVCLNQSPDCKERTAPSTSLPQNHYEILLRMIDEDGTIVSPMKFIPTAERFKLMPAIDRWVIRTLFGMLARHFRSGMNSQTDKLSSQYSINLSGASINEIGFIDFVREQFDIYKIPPKIICFEITETVAISNLNRAIQLMHALRNMGCQFSLDDFGSGMSSFAYLKSLPIDYLKIDGSFVKDIIKDSVAEAIVASINRIAQEMGIQTIAEFVSSKAILQKISALGVNHAQGYVIDQPRPLIL
ncbi:EAL domain-containing protein [Pseudanabaena sp. PCC 6802]|uniref:EAL domain-containing protein n=1 Tax=Pseudanabaena sp. PCC 6802 TaxID=118173 RepID=UPI00034A180B|nr:EAL domain-containing protein [Pseudanabaena sp. PCC 6802]